MKKNILILSSALLLSASTFMIGCKKDDTTAPVVTINGSDVSLLLQDSYVDAGATANDDEDGAITVVTTSSVNTDLVGVYTVTYSATDAAGNEGTATRTVTVKNGQESMEGKYDGSETDAVGPYTYAGNTDATKTVTVTISNIVRNRIFMTRLGDFANNTVYMNITGTNIDMPNQTVNNVGTGTSTCDVHNRRSSGTGVKTTAPVGFTLTYSDEKLAPCSGSRATVNAVFIKK